MDNFEIAIVGGGVIGSAISWELSKYNVDVVVFEKGSDVASGTSKANSGVIHSGINSKPGSLKVRFCVEGNKTMQSLSDQLGFSLKWTGKYIIAKNEDELKELQRLKVIGEKNKVMGLEIHDGNIVNKKEPNLTCYAGLWVPTAGIILPYEFTITLAENAAENGVKFFLETKVNDIIKEKERFIIKTNKGIFTSDILINSTGINCRKIVSMLEEPDFQIYPCRGEYLVLDKQFSNLINSMIYPIPKEEIGVLGIHITPTVEGNILIGPSAEFINDYNDKKTTKKMMRALISESRELIPAINDKDVINAYSGIRCKLASESEGGMADYKIEESKKTSGLINLIGIESPGLTAAPAIAKEVVKLVSKHISLKNKDNFKIIKKKKRFLDLSYKEQSELIKEDERWGRIVCRCEHVTEAEIIKALSNPLGARSLSSVKYRVRAGMGRCQGGFCTQHIIRIMEKEFDINIRDIKMKSPNSYFLYGRNREKNNDYS